MKYLLLKDKRRRILTASYEFKRNWLKSLYQNQNLSLKFKEFIYFVISYQLPKDTSPIRFKNRCVLTNRPRAIYRKFGISRLMFRKYIWQGKLIGFRKASW